jgi:hypothetical protein
MVIWYFLPILVCCTKNNLATLPCRAELGEERPSSQEVNSLPSLIKFYCHVLKVGQMKQISAEKMLIFIFANLAWFTGSVSRNL